MRLTTTDRIHEFQFTDLYDGWIRDQFPKFQDVNRANPAVPLYLDFSSCVWTSPLPMLAIATEIASYSSPDRSIYIDLGEGASTDPQAPRRSRVRKFLMSHGFLDCFLSRPDLNVLFQYDRNAELGDQGEWLKGQGGLSAIRGSVAKVAVELLYGDIIVLPASIFKLPSTSSPNWSGSVRAYVADKLRQADNALFRFKTEARRYRDVTLQRLNQVLLELIENASEHAYRTVDEGIGHVGLYARVRQTNDPSASAARNSELANSPLLGSILLSEKQHQLEVFVVDVGRGLFQDLPQWTGITPELRKSQQPLRDTSSILFLNPISRHNRSDGAVAKLRGTSTGLMHLHQILSHQKDSTRIITGQEWLAGTHPRPPGFQNDTASTGGYRHQAKAIRGTIFHVGISPSEIPKLDHREGWFVSDDPDNALVREAVANKLAAATPQSVKTLTSAVIDVRSGDGQEDIQKQVFACARRFSATVVRVNRIIEKNLVTTIIRSWLEGIAKGKPKRPLLYLCDLGRFQAIDTRWVIEKVFRYEERVVLPFVPVAASIYLLTEDLCCLEFEVQFQEVSASTYRIIISRQADPVQRIENRLVYILQALRVCDSKRLWDRIVKLDVANSAAPILIKDVLWNPKASHVLPYYLDFSALVQDREAARYVRRSLRRLLSLFPDANDQPLDDVVESSLHDAKKWLVRPQSETQRRVLVGSLSVSGSTLKRYEPAPKVKIVAVIDCIKTPYYIPSETTSAPPHLAALLWHPSLSRQVGEIPRFQRLRQTAFVEPLDGNYRPPVPTYDENLYSEAERGKLLKIGHWMYGDRHCLMELNIELAIDQSGASESGAIPWLVQRIQAACATSRVVLAFPVNRLSYRLAHSTVARIDPRMVESGRLVLLPLSFLPRVASGVTRFAPLTAATANALAKGNDGESPIAVFLDFGYITNRTLRHAVRQLHASGFREVQAIGLLNRSSAPMFDAENPNQPSTVPVPETYWRWNVPTLGTGTHCALCNALPVLTRLRKVLEEAHIDLVEPLEEIAKEWVAKDVADFWEEHGLDNSPLSATVRQHIAEFLTDVPSECLPTTSGSLISRAIERIRITGDAAFPIAIAEMLIAFDAVGCAVELTASTMLLAGGGLSPSLLRDYARLLTKGVIALASTSNTSPAFPRVQRTLGLASLTISALPSACKISTFDTICAGLTSTDVTSAPYVRIFLISLTTDSDESTAVQDEFRRRSETSNDSSLLSNYHSLRPQKGSVRESLEKLTRAFGRSESHSQQSVLGKVRSHLTRSRDIRSPSGQLACIAGLLGQCDGSYLMKALSIDARRAIEEVHSLMQPASQSIMTVEQYQHRIDSVLGVKASKLHKVLVRYGNRASSPLVYNLFYGVLREQCALNSLELGHDIQLSRRSQTLRWPDEIGDYLPIDGHLATLIGEIFSNIGLRSERFLPPSHLRDASPCEALAWIEFDLSAEPADRGVTVLFITGTKGKATEYKPKVPGLSDFGISVASRNFTEDARNYFEIRVRIPSLSTVLGGA